MMRKRTACFVVACVFLVSDVTCEPRPVERIAMQSVNAIDSAFIRNKFLIWMFPVTMSHYDEARSP